MVSRKYPLDPLRKLKEQRVTERTREAAESRAAHERAQASAARARAAREAEQSQAQSERQRERELLEDGQVRAADLQQGERFWVFAAARITRLAQGEMAADERARGAAAEAGKALSALAEAKAEAQALERHHQRHREGEQRAQEAAEDETMLERWTSDKHGVRRG